MAENKTLEHLPEMRAAVAALSPEDRELLAAVQTSPFKLTALEQFKEFAANIDYFVFEPNIHNLNDLGWRYLAQHMDMLLPPELLKAIDPVPFGKYAMQEEQGHFRNTDIFLFPATSGIMNALRSRRKALHPGTAGTGQERMCGEKQDAAPQGKVCAGTVRRC